MGFTALSEYLPSYSCRCPPPNASQVIDVCVAVGVFAVGSFVLVLVITRARTGIANLSAATWRTRDLVLWTAATLQTIAQIGQQV
jgi:hypothetical protein